MNFARRQGEIIGAIHTYEEMLQRAETPLEQLLALSQDDLKRLAEDLKGQALRK